MGLSEENIDSLDEYYGKYTLNTYSPVPTDGQNIRKLNSLKLVYCQLFP